MSTAFDNDLDRFVGKTITVDCGDSIGGPLGGAEVTGVLLRRSEGVYSISGAEFTPRDVVWLEEVDHGV